MQIKIAEGIFKREYNRIIEALGGIGHTISWISTSCSAWGTRDITRARRAAKATSKSPSNIYYSAQGPGAHGSRASPFGCMPSTQSDGAQSAVMSHYKDMIFIPIETSGEGDVNAHSRVQMALGEAKAKTKPRPFAALDASGRTIEEIFVVTSRSIPNWKSPMYKVPRTGRRSLALLPTSSGTLPGWRRPRASKSSAPASRRNVKI